MDSLSCRAKCRLMRAKKSGAATVLTVKHVEAVPSARVSDA
jgi:hypothetical protein